MYDPSKIVTWLAANVKMRRSRAKTLAAITSGPMCMLGTGVLALGRAMEGPTSAKHRIKRVDRFLGNAQVETEAFAEGMFHALRPRTGHVVVLADWTDRHPFQQLVFALPCNGRAMPFYSITVEKGDGSGAHDGLMIEAEELALRALDRICGATIRPIIIADRGFGNTRWLSSIANRGWHFVQRIARNHYVETESFTGNVYELGIRRGYTPRSHGRGTMGEKHWGPIELISVYDREANEPWYLVTNLPHHGPKQIVALYTKRMWIEAMFRDLKNRNWGLGMDNVRLTTQGRHDRHLMILALAYILLAAFGAAAESQGLGKKLKANTVPQRVLALARIGSYYLRTLQTPIPCAINKMLELPT